MPLSILFDVLCTCDLRWTFFSDYYKELLVTSRKTYTFLPPKKYLKSCIRGWMAETQQYLPHVLYNNFYEDGSHSKVRLMIYFINVGS